jgi:hypothetical protein
MAKAGEIDGSESFIIRRIKKDLESLVLTSIKIRDKLSVKLYHAQPILLNLGHSCAKLMIRECFDFSLKKPS